MTIKRFIIALLIALILLGLNPLTVNAMVTSNHYRHMAYHHYTGKIKTSCHLVDGLKYQCYTAINQLPVSIYTNPISLTID